MAACALREPLETSPPPQGSPRLPETPKYFFISKYRLQVFNCFSRPHLFMVPQGAARPPRPDPGTGPLGPRPANPNCAGHDGTARGCGGGPTPGLIQTNCKHFYSFLGPYINSCGAAEADRPMDSVTADSDSVTADSEADRPQVRRDARAPPERRSSPRPAGPLRVCRDPGGGRRPGAGRLGRQEASTDADRCPGARPRGAGRAGVRPARPESSESAAARPAPGQSTGSPLAVQVRPSTSAAV